MAMPDQPVNWQPAPLTEAELAGLRDLYTHLTSVWPNEGPTGQPVHNFARLIATVDALRADLASAKATVAELEHDLVTTAERCGRATIADLARVTAERDAIEARLGFQTLSLQIVTDRLQATEAERDAALKRVVLLREVMAHLEWSEEHGCPTCDKLEGTGHESDCMIGMALAATATPSPIEASNG